MLDECLYVCFVRLGRVQAENFDSLGGQAIDRQINCFDVLFWRSRDNHRKRARVHQWKILERLAGSVPVVQSDPIDAIKNSDLLEFEALLKI